MHSPRLHENLIPALHSAAVHLHLERDALLDGVNPAFVLSIQRRDSATAQFLTDLHVLNNTELLVDRSDPLVTWLRNAATLGAGRVEAAIFSDCLGMLTPPPIVPQTTALQLSSTSPSAPRSTSNVIGDDPTLDSLRPLAKPNAGLDAEPTVTSLSIVSRLSQIITSTSCLLHRARNVPKFSQFNLTGSAVLLGRQSHCEICLTGEGISRHHARLVLTGDGWTLEDAGAKNGTLLNRERLVRPTTLASGDQFRVGGHVFEFFTAQSVAELRRVLEQHIEHGRYADVVTGLVNRDFMVQTIETQLTLLLSSTQLNGRRCWLALLSICGFQEILAAAGDTDTDVLLYRFGQLASTYIGASAEVGRVENGEFFVCFDDAARDVVEQAIDDVCMSATSISRSFPILGRGVGITDVAAASAELLRSDVSPETLYRRVRGRLRVDKAT